uniref:Uncharacterized protein n=1 Tax=Setaria viridis TaxID=4556 RepID=A0A4U6WJG4_SETVI|nr:hypothetical protein SEVIR_1G380950v2 [Setaria viridis]
MVCASCRDRAHQCNWCSSYVWMKKEGVTCCHTRHIEIGSHLICTMMSVHT